MTDPKTSVASYAASGTAVFFGLTANEVAAIVGAAVAVLTFLLNWYYKHQHLKAIERRMSGPLNPIAAEADE